MKIVCILRLMITSEYKQYTLVFQPGGQVLIENNAHHNQ